MDFKIILEMLGMLLAGGAFVKIFDVFFMSKKDKDNSMLMLLERLQLEIDRMQKKQDLQDVEINELRMENRDLAKKYLAEIELKNNLQGEVVKLTSELKKFNRNQNQN